MRKYYRNYAVSTLGDGTKLGRAQLFEANNEHEVGHYIGWRTLKGDDATAEKFTGKDVEATFPPNSVFHTNWVAKKNEDGSIKEIDGEPVVVKLALTTQEMLSEEEFAAQGRLAGIRANVRENNGVFVPRSSAKGQRIVEMDEEIASTK